MLFRAAPASGTGAACGRLPAKKPSADPLTRSEVALAGRCFVRRLCALGNHHRAGKALHDHMTPPSGPVVALLGTVFLVLLLTPGAFRSSQEDQPAQSKGGF